MAKWVNARHLFWGEHCEYSCVHPFRKLNQDLNGMLNRHFFSAFS
jgi:hypothetical protein